MFRRKRSSSNPPRPSSTTPNAAAALAASQAFLASQASNANLSASAAAAALRSHTPTPTPVGQVQTKRMQRRASVSSNGSAPGRPVGLQRRDSGGSMTERSFREPSPSRPPERPASSHGPYPKHQNDAPPPVPALPHRYASPSPPVDSLGARSASLQPKSQHRSTDRDVRLNRGSTTVLAPPGGKQRSTSSGVSSAAHLAANQANSRASINFSRPMSPQNTPPPGQSAPMRAMSPTLQVKGTAGLPLSEANSIAASLQNVATQPVKKKKKKKITNETNEGSHLNAQLSSDHSPAATMISNREQKEKALSPAQPLLGTSNPKQVIERDAGKLPVTPQVKTKKKRKGTSTLDPRTLESENFGSAYPSDTDSAASDVSTTTDRPRVSNISARSTLGKQPSVVREDREGEEKAEGRISAAKPAPKAGSNGGYRSTAAAEPTHTATKNSTKIQDQSLQGPKVEGPTLEIPGTAPPSSLSPTRALHFSTQPAYDIAAGTRHQPLGRSASPAKSAMKHSPSRGSSPSLLRTKGLATSETSDTGSGLSDDGSQPGKKQKRNVRVSFDAESVVVGQAASPVKTESPVLMSPQNRTKAKGGLDQLRNAGSEVSDSDPEAEDTAIKPIPALPSFGSIRSREALSRMGNSALSSVDDQSKISDVGMSRDHNVGHILSQQVSLPGNTDYQASNAAAEPKDTTTIEVPKNGPLLPRDIDAPTSTTDANASEASIQHPFQATVVPPTLSTNEPSEVQAYDKQTNDLVPSIAVMPATPAADEGRGTVNEWLGMPGDFPGAPEAPEAATEPKQSIRPMNVQANNSPVLLPTEQLRSSSEDRSSLPASGRTSPVVTPATVGIAEPEPEALAAQHDTGTPHVGEVAESMRTQIDSQNAEEATEEDSVYSDAAEDQTETEGDGFGSINAIVESPGKEVFGSPSPVFTPSVEGADSASRDTPQALPTTEAFKPGEATGFENAQAYWAGLSDARRRQLESAALPGAADERVLPDKTLRGKGSIAKKAKKQPAQQNTSMTSQGDDTNRTRNVPRTPLNEVSAPKAKKSAQNPTVSRPDLDAAYQPGSGQPSMVEPKGVLRKKGRPGSAVAMVDSSRSQPAVAPMQGRAMFSNKPIDASVPTTSPQPKKKSPKPRMGRTKSEGSDSDSSFKRLRSSAPDTGRYQMKRSMRAGTPGTGQGPSTNRSLGARVPSPSSSTARRPFSTAGPGGPGMRMSMRDSIDSSKQGRKTMRHSMDSAKVDRAKSPTRLGFRLGSKAKPGHAKTASKAESSYSGRFGDSSDDDILPELRGSSRFADSSDDEPTSLAPVRGIPRKIDEGDSTDLEDSSTENVQAPNSGKSIDTQPTTVSAPSTKPEGKALAAGSLRTTPSKTPALGVDTSVSATQPAEKEKKKRSIFGSFAGKRKEEPRARKPTKDTLGPPPSTPSKQIPIATPTSPDAAALSEPSTAQPSPKPPKLQRRNTPNGLESTSQSAWPFQPDAEATGKAPSRPQTSDGPSAGSPSARPDLGDRRITLQSAPDADAIEKAGKKKKRFPMLRKAFGLKK